VEGVEHGVALDVGAETKAPVPDLESCRGRGEGHVRHRPGAVRPLHACGVEDVIAMNLSVGQPQGLVNPALQGPCERG